MKDIILSLCISSYNHGDKCVQLVNQILTVKDSRYNIVICDDCSDESTVRELKKIFAPQVKLVQNKHNLGPCKNWFKTLDNGIGKYVLHVLDRDTIDIKYLPLILDILEKSTVGGGYFGKSALYPVKEVIKGNYYSICKKGRSAFLTMAGVPVHPTGFFIQRNVWKEGNYKQLFYRSDKYGIYPHSYVLGMVAVNNDMIFSSIPFYSYTYRDSNKISRFYEKNNQKEYWWLPENVIKTDNRLMFYLSKVADESYKADFIYRRYKDALIRATFVYKRVSANQQEMEHYGLPAKYISEWELLWIAIKFKMCFTHILVEMNMDNAKNRKCLSNIWREHVGVIVRRMKMNKAEELLYSSNKNFLQFQMMNQWVKLKQKKNSFSSYFEDRGYRQIAIYGMGVIGQTLLDELQGSNVDVIYGIDRNANKAYSQVMVLPLNAEFPTVDAVVVTVIESFEEILQGLKEKFHCPIISLMDVVYDA